MNEAASTIDVERSIAPADVPTDVLAALADPTRQRLLDLISAAGSTTASTLAPQLPISRQAIVKHLQILEDAELLERETQGRSVLFSVRAERCAEAARWLAATATEWGDRAARLRAARLRDRSDGLSDQPIGHSPGVTRPDS